MSTKSRNTQFEDEVESLRWFVREWYTHNDAPFPYLFEQLTGSLEAFQGAGIKTETVQECFSKAFADKRDWDGGEDGRYLFACRITWDTHGRKVKQERMERFGKMNVEDVLKELDALDEGEIQP